MRAASAGVSERGEPGFVCLSQSRGLHQTLLIDHGPGCCCLCSGVGLAEEAGGAGELNKVGGRVGSGVGLQER